MFKKFIEEEKNKPYFKTLVNKINKISQPVFPKKEDWFRSLEMTSFSNLKVVVIGQDPYHNKNQANGLAFAVNDGVKVPPSLKNIYKELSYEYGYQIPNHGDLSAWSKEGVLLSNTILTVTENEPLSHQGFGWEIFISNLFQLLQTKDNLVYLLWGNYAHQFAKKITNKTHVVIKTSHPSPLSFYRSFYRSNMFKKTNEILINKGLTKINWEIK